MVINIKVDGQLASGQKFCKMEDTLMLTESAWIMPLFGQIKCCSNQHAFSQLAIASYNLTDPHKAVISKLAETGSKPEPKFY